MKDKTKLILEIGDNIASWETDHFDVSLDELYSAFEGLLVTHTFPYDSIETFNKERAEELNQIYSNDED